MLENSRKGLTLDFNFRHLSRENILLNLSVFSRCAFLILVGVFNDDKMISLSRFDSDVAKGLSVEIQPV